jgi:hypothetical protein
MSGSVTWATSVSASTNAIVSNINSFQTNYLASMRDGVCIQFYPNNNTYRTDTLSFTASGFTPTIVQTCKTAQLVKATYNVKGQIYFNNAANNTIFNMRVTFPRDSAGRIGEPINSGKITNNF